MSELKKIKTVEEAKQLVNQRKLSHIKVGLFDNDGVLRGKYMARGKFFSALDSGFSFCDVILGWDCKDRIYDNTSVTGWHTGFPDKQVRVLPETVRELPYEENMLLFLAEFSDEAEQVCPRGILRKVIEKAASMGLWARAACEYEFFLFQETPDSIREKGYRNLKPFTPDSFGYSVIRNSVHSELYQQIIEMAQVMNFPIESIHTETGPGVIEAALMVDDILSAADKAALFKTFMKVLAERNGLMATFMARWSSELAGQSGHIHMSLVNANGESVFYDPSKPYGMSALQKHFIAGQQRLMPEFLALLAPTINSYRRLVPGYWAPTRASWGIENRTCALRLIPGNAKSQRVEYRLGAADASPYLALAAVLASGLYGIEHELEPTEAVSGNAYSQKFPDEQTLPRSLYEAAQLLKGSEAALSYFGKTFVDHYAATREWEEMEFRKHVTDWELARYFEII
ncbi:glutamine synthetase family protein [Endozoicomonas numazuensis]|uniref:Glutamine synthetase n=1 Tax=Endozoicomonas numazuensis TaxID=1137799 RepID=A0A081NLL9_9GAMM|nr:glutamine synthetase [Endozoicomonas numazuensis]KEQ19342.1 glutamine synthetase [Endozoicomonas numazuensis]